jgi:hypothetical protein
MKATYRSENPSTEGLEDKEIRKQIKEKKLPSGFATYQQALLEASQRKQAADPKHIPKALDYQQNKKPADKAKRAEKAQQKKAKKE